MNEDDTRLHYERRGDAVRVQLRGLTNHELRAVLVGLWARMDRADQEDFVDELRHYLQPESRLSPLSQAVASTSDAPNVIDVAKHVAAEWREPGTEATG